MARAIAAVAWVVAGAMVGVGIGLVIGLIVGTVVGNAVRPGRFSQQDLVTALIGAIACGTATVVGALAGAAGGIVWGLGYRRPRGWQAEEMPRYQTRALED